MDGDGNPVIKVEDSKNVLINDRMGNSTSYTDPGDTPDLKWQPMSIITQSLVQFASYDFGEGPANKDDATNKVSGDHYFNTSMMSPYDEDGKWMETWYTDDDEDGTMDSSEQRYRMVTGTYARLSVAEAVESRWFYLSDGEAKISSHMSTGTTPNLRLRHVPEYSNEADRPNGDVQVSFRSSWREIKDNKLAIDIP